MSNRFFARSSAVAAAVMISSVAGAATFTDYNLVVLGNHSFGSDVQGTAFIGGNLTGNGDFGIALNPAAFQGVDVLTVAGSMNGNFNVNAGNVRRAGSRSGTLSLNGVGGTEITDPTVVSMVSTLQSQMDGASDALLATASNSNVQLPNGQPGPAIFQATPGGPGNIAVFNVSGSQIFSNNLVQQIELNVNGASAIIVNVSGTNINFNQGNMVGSWNSAFARANTIWNFFEATSISFDRNMNGAVLAPLAHLSNTSNIDGSVFVGSFTQNGEVHLPSYGGPVPAPGVVGMVALAGLLGARRRR